mmetsp:Transcript_15618/g.27916  ORF Transcript_15618/g.27916 Transcript_15618/m.27916 type:complete len:170 (-) Transcript_15618:166-675(-)
MQNVHDEMVALQAEVRSLRREAELAKEAAKKSDEDAARAQREAKAKVDAIKQKERILKSNKATGKKLAFSACSIVRALAESLSLVEEQLMTAWKTTQTALEKTTEERKNELIKEALEAMTNMRILLFPVEEDVTSAEFVTPGISADLQLFTNDIINKYDALLESDQMTE